MTPRRAFKDQQHHSKERGIPFLFSYSEWLEMWLLSGEWEERGKRSGQYVMARFEDKGAYSPRNCKICTVEENQRDRVERIEVINNKEAEEIRSLYRNTRLPQSEVANMFEVSQSYVSRIVNNKRRAV